MVGLYPRPVIGFWAEIPTARNNFRDGGFPSLRKHSGRLDTQLNQDSLTAAYDDGKTNLTFNGSFAQLNQPDELTREIVINNPNTFVGTPALIKRNTYSIGGNDEEVITDKTSVSAGVTYADTQYQTPGYADLNSTTVPVNYYYKVDPKVDVSLGAAYTTSSVGSSLGAPGIKQQRLLHQPWHARSIHAAAVGPVSVGLGETRCRKARQFDHIRDQFQLHLLGHGQDDHRLWNQNGYGYNAFGAGFENTGGNVTVSTALNEQWSIHADAAYNYLSYLNTSENDNYYVFGVGASYTFNKEHRHLRRI